jgi:hypothetical protein
MADGYSLELSYRWSGRAQVQGQAVLELGGLAWELPGDFSFLDTGPFDPDSLLIHYAVPLTPGILEGMTLHWNSEWNSENAAPGESPALMVKGLSLVPRRFGFSFNENNGLSIDLSPFVYYRDQVLHIDPPASFRCSEALRLSPHGPGGLIVETGSSGNPGYFRIEDEKPEDRFIVHQAFLSSAAYPLRISGSSLSEAWLIQNITPIMEPIPADPGMILPWPQETWRDARFELFSWDSFPSILIFDFADYTVQDRFLKRLAFFAEKTGFRGRLARDSEIAHLHGWNAHDYRSETLAAFFDAARKANFPLLAEEWELEAILLNAGIIGPGPDGTIVPGQGAVISITRESPDYLRSLFMAHEGFHGIFFIDEDFRNFSRTRWEGLGQAPRNFILSYFDYQAYDITDTYLVINEFMAHVLQQPVSQAGRYFGETLAARIDASSWRRTVLPPKDEATNSWPGLADAFRAEAEAFSSYVNQRWGLAAGRVRKVSVIR